MAIDRHEIIRRRERLWYPEPQRVELLHELHEIATDPERHRGYSLAVVAEPNGGKSSLVKRYMALHPVVRGEAALEVPAIYIHMSAIYRVEDLSITLLEALGVPDASKGNHSARLKRFIALAKKVKLGLVFLDEFHDCATTTGRGEPFTRCIKALMNEEILVVPVGTEMLAKVLEMDPQFSTRFGFSQGRLGRLEELGHIKAIMCKITELSSDAISDDAVSYVGRETKGILGHTLDIIERTYIRYGDLSLGSLRKQREIMDVLNRVV